MVPGRRHRDGKGTLTQEAAVRGLIFGIAALCFAAALAMFGAGMRLTAPQPTLVVMDAPAQAPVAPQPAPRSEAPSVASPPPTSGQLQTSVEALAREQSASRELVSELRTTVAQLQMEITRQSSALQAGGPQGRTLIALCCDLLPPGQGTLGDGAWAAVRQVLPEIMADTRQLVSVEGHSDSRPIRTRAGKPFKDNADLSLLRARSVAALLQKNGVAANRIRVKGWADTRPLVSNDTAEGRDRNRRVEIRLLSASPER